MGKIEAVVGSESHSTSRGSASITINGAKVSWIKGSPKPVAGNNKHKNYYSAQFEVRDGDEVVYSATASRGNRGSDVYDFKKKYRYDSSVEVVDIKPDVGYPCDHAILSGRLVEGEDCLAVKERDRRDDL